MKNWLQDLCQYVVELRLGNHTGYLLNDITPLDVPRKIIGAGALLLFLLTFVPQPF